MTFNGGLNPTAFDTTKLVLNLLNAPLFVASVVRRDTQAAGAGASEWGIRAITATGCVIHKITASGAHVAEEVLVTIDGRHSIGR